MSWIRTDGERNSDKPGRMSAVLAVNGRPAQIGGSDATLGTVAMRYDKLFV